MPTRLLIVAALSLILAACATPEPTPPVANAAAPTVASADNVRIVCHRETPTGSTISHNVCEKEGGVEDRQLATDLANEAQRNRPVYTNGGVGSGSR